MRLAVALLASVATFASLAADPARATEDTATADAPGASNSEIIVTARKLNEARASIQPSTGASLYDFDAAALDALPGGRNAALNQVLLRAPGVAQDSFGQLHIRGDHNGIQFRVNGVILPEGLSVFGQSISPRFADSVTLLTGALPAQYGLRVAGVVNIATKGSGFDNAGSISIYGGSHGQVQPAIEFSGTSGNDSYFVSGSYLHGNLGIEAPDRSRTPLHDTTDQFQGFGYFDHIIDDENKLTLIFGTSNEEFQIPNLRGLQPSLGLTVNGNSAFPSENLDGRQHEVTHYAIASLLHDKGDFTGQLSVFGRYSSLRYTPDAGYGELLYNGISQSAYKRDVAVGLQAEGKYTLSDTHILRAGAVIQRDRATSRTASAVLLLADDGSQIGDTPSVIDDSSATTAWTYTAYLQDEWKPFDKLTINYGVRYDRFQGFLTEQQLSPRVNFVLEPGGGFTLHGGYSRYFTPPPFELVGNASVASFVGTTAQFPNGIVSATPRSERSNYFDLGFVQKVGALSLGIDAYYKIARNLIDEGQFGAPIILTPFNYERGKVRGIEFTANYQKGPWTAYGNVAVSNAQGENITSSQATFDPGDLAYIANHYIPLDHDQRTTGSAGISWASNGHRIAADMLYGSGLRADGATPNGNKLPAYATVNLSASQTINLGQAGLLDLRFDAINVLDRKYEIRDGTGIGVGAPQFGQRQGFFIGATKHF